VFLTSVVSFLTALFLAWLLLSCLLRSRLALRPGFLGARRGWRLVALGGYLLGMLPRLLPAFCFLRGFLTARRGCQLLALNRCLLRVLHRRAFHLRRGNGQC
jgi:hypothetical protein